MSTPNKQLIDAIQRIAEGSPLFTEVRGLLKEIQRRGGIEGLKLKIGEDGDAAEDCCTDGKKGDEEPSEEDAADITGDAPPEVPDIGDEDRDGESEWSDCETGDPITFTPGGFPQPETCKDCSRPDPTWEEGYYFSLPSYPQYVAATATQACQDFVAGHTGNTYVGVEFDAAYGAIVCVSKNDFIEESKAIMVKIACGSSTADYCTLTEPPIISDCQDWEPDGATSYTLADGCIVASSCDPDAAAQAQQCNECITICNEDGEERRVCAIGNGQWILYDPNGKYKGGRYDATGRRLEILPAGETGGYLPSERASGGGGGYDGGTIGGGDGWVWS